MDTEKDTYLETQYDTNVKEILIIYKNNTCASFKLVNGGMKAREHCLALDL